ncbi:MAG: DUF1294 domain-containing protein [Oscillospiraceae bacterium]|nr:DUF1294 domain-containing protein [Oscillospiraceae bacterium]
MFLWIQNHWQWLIGYLAAASAAGFLLMGSDKIRAQKGRWRVPEKALFGAALLGGTPGCLAGMYLFRHKTRHWYFRWGMPLILLVQVATAIWIFCRIKRLC